MKYKQTKFAFQYTPTSQWVYIWHAVGDEGYVHLLDDFHPDCLYSARNIIEEDISFSFWSGNKIGKVGSVNRAEFTLRQIEINYECT